MITIPGKLSYSNFESLLPDLTTDQLNQLNNSVSLAPNKIVGVNINNITKGTDKTFSIRLVKWVEPYKIGGIDYSLFYTEVDHNFKVGDRCFIEGGFYDSDNFISNNGYNAGVDGYKVLYVDRTKIVLDIEYTGDLPTNEEEIDDFVKVYVANSQYEFDFYCQMLSMRNDSGIIENRFQLGLNNFLYLNGTFSITPNAYDLTSFASDFALTTTPNQLGNSWVVRGTTASNNYMVNISNDVLSNNITPYLNSSYTQSNSGFFNLEKLRIMNSKFTSGLTDFMNERIYYYDSTQNRWRVDKTYLPTIITENHFKGGFFKGGSFNQGLYGVHEERLEYNGNNIQWNLGTTLNVDWKNGTLDSQVYDPDSFFTVFDRDGLPQIRANAENNGGAGYNYVFNTEFTGGDIINGNIFNMSSIVGTNSLTQSTILNYYTGQTQSYSVEIKGGVYYNSDISFATMSNSTFISSYVLNSYIDRCKGVNSEVESSVFLNSTWISDRIVKIQAYEESNIVWYDELNNPVNYKMYKFYLTDSNWRRLREFQNFYIDGIGINIPSDELLRFFDDKFSLGHWFQTYDVVGSKPERRILVQLSTKEENRNSPGNIVTNINELEPNFNNPLPSIDLFISGGDDFDYGTSSSYPRPFISETIDIKNGYILDSDFISGLFKDSRWISGNYFNYNQDYSFTSGSGYTASVTASTAELTLNIGGNWRPDILGTQSDVSTIAFVNGLWYDSTLNGGDNLVKLPDVYRINDIIGTSSRQIVLQDILTQSVYNSIVDFTNQQYLLTPNAKNQYNYIHPVKFENSQIYSGIFRRAYFESCLFDNFEFNLEDKDLEDVTNKRKLLVSDIILDGDNNTIKSGLFQYSHKIAGNEDWQNGIFHRGVWNTTAFTYSFGSTSSVIYESTNVPFKNGIVRNTTWEFGQFDNGLFYKNKSNIVGTSSVFDDSRTVYYYEGYNTRWTWKDGTFNNGDFERSNFEMGILNDGNFYDSDWLIGEAFGGNFGKSNIPFEKTRIWEGTFSNANVINANFRSGDILDSSNTSANSLIYWNSGVFRSGVFGTIDDNNYDPTDSNNNRAIWNDGIFKGGDFKDSAEWKNGQFDGGRFLSYYWYEPLSPRTPFELNTFTSASFSWQGGKFNGGQFGTGETISNSTWYTGEFNGGLFQGRYWRDGIFTRGNFLGHAATQSGYSTDSDNYNSFINSFNTNYFGYWQNGFVSKVKDKFIKNEKLWSDVERVSTKKKKNPLINFSNMLWNSGTFSAFDGEMDNSVWLDGAFQEGYFANSVFNPYINLALPIFVDGTFSNGWINSGASASSSGNNLIIENYSFTTSTLTLPQCLYPSELYTIQIEVISNSGISLDIEGESIFNSSDDGIIFGTFSANDVDLTLLFTGAGDSVEFANLTIYPGTQSGFRIEDSCIWENGEAYSSDFYFSKWKQGIFDSYADSLQGNAWGLIWQDGITKYMNAYNVFWEKGIWKNGNWFGSPFQQIATYSGYQVYPGFAEDIMNNVSDWASFSQLNTWDSIHMNDTFTGSLGSDLLIDPEFNNNTPIGWNGSDWVWQPSYNKAQSNGIPLVIFGENNMYSNMDSAVSTLLNTSSSEDIFQNVLQQYIIEIKYAAYYDTSQLSMPFPEIKIRFDIGYIGGISGDTLEGTFISQNGGIRRNLNIPLKSVFEKPIFSGPGWIGSYQNTISFNYTPTNLDLSNSKKIRITRLTHSGESAGMKIYILSASVKELNYEYDPNTNNLLNLIPSWNPQIGSTISLPNTIYQLGSTNPLRARFGNGNFRSGIWENGVWNEGWRDDETVIWASDIDKFNGGKNKAYKELSKWTFTLDIIPTFNNSEQSPNSFNNFNIGDKVSIGNIVMKDINGNRRLIKDYLTVVDKFEGLRQNPLSLSNQINSRLLTVEFETTFPIFTIERDSDDHLIHISKNVWLNGVFLNGKFLNGVWNNGLMRGFPYITQMVDAQWIDGTFKGGRFIGLTNSYIDNFGNSVDYHTGLIQKFRYYDENVSGIPFRFKFNSFIDVNYFNTSGVNINRLNETFVQTPAGFTASYIDNNHYGYPTKDVLESTSTIRNGFDLISRNYKLGWKWKEYQEWIPQQEIQFNGVNQFEWINSSSSDEIVYVDNGSGYGLDNLSQFGWTFGYGSGDIFANSTTDIINNWGTLPIELQNKLILNGGNPNPAVSGLGIENYTLDFIDNNEVEIERLRYCYVETTGENLSPRLIGNELNPIVFFNNYPASYSVAAKTFYYGNTQSTITIPVNQFATSSISNQREYFFNKKGLEMTLLGGADSTSGTFSLAFEKIRLVETDMIPFLNFVGGCVNITSDGTEEVVSPPLPEWEEEGITISFKSSSTNFGGDNPWGNFYGTEQVESITNPPNPRRSYRDLQGSGYYRVWYWYCDPEWGTCQLAYIQFGTDVEVDYRPQNPVGTAQIGLDYWHTLLNGGPQLFSGAPGYNQTVYAAFEYALNPDADTASGGPYIDTHNSYYTQTLISYFDNTTTGQSIPNSQNLCNEECITDPCVTINFGTQIVQCTSVGGCSTGANPGDIYFAPAAQNGTPPYTYTWTYPNGIQQVVTSPGIISDPDPGLYTLTISDSNGCEDVVTFTVTDFACQLNVNIIDNGTQLQASVTYEGLPIQPDTVTWIVTDDEGVITTFNNNESTWNNPLEGYTYQVNVTYSNGVLDCSSNDYLTIPTQEVSFAGEGLVAKLFMRFAGYTQSYTNYPGDGGPVTVEYNAVDPISGTYMYLPYYENTDWGYTLQVIYQQGTGWVFRHLPFNHPVDPTSSLGNTSGINTTRIIAEGPTDVSAMESGLINLNWNVKQDVSWNGTIDSSSVTGQDRDIVSEVIQTEPGNTTVTPLNMIFTEPGSNPSDGDWDLQFLPLFLLANDTQPVSYKGFRKRDTTQGNQNPIPGTPTGNQLEYINDYYNTNYSKGEEAYIIWLENATEFTESLQWDIYLPFENFLQTPTTQNPANYELVRQPGDWTQLGVGEDGDNWYNFYVQPIDFIPSSEEENPTVVDTTIFAGNGELLCFDYLNHDIQVPYIAKSPDIDSDILTNYIGSVNIWIPDVNINTVEANDVDVNNLYPSADRRLSS